MGDNPITFTPIDVIFDSSLLNYNTPGINGSTDFPTFTMNPGIKDVIGMCVLWTNVPFSYYVIDNTNN